MKAAARTKLGWAAIIFPGIIAAAISLGVTEWTSRKIPNMVRATVEIRHDSRLILIRSDADLPGSCIITADFKLAPLNLGDRNIYSIGSIVLSGRGTLIPSITRPIVITIPAGIPPGIYNLIGQGVSDCTTLLTLDLMFEVRSDAAKLSLR